MNPASKLLILAAALSFAVPALLHADPIDTHALATLAVQDHGRKKPFTTFAQESLLTLTGSSSLPVSGTDTRMPAEEVALDLWFTPQGWDEKPIILVTFAELKKRIGLPVETEKKLFTYQELINNKALMDLLDETQKVEQTDKDKLTAVQKEGEHLAERLRLFQDLVNGQRQMIVPNAHSNEGRWGAIQDVGPGLALWPATEGKDDVSAANAGDAISAFTDWANAYRHGDIAKFNEITPKLVDALRQMAPEYYPPASALQFEHHYMTLHPFRWAWIIYFLAIIILLLTAIWTRDFGYKLGWLLVLGGLAFEAYGFFCRIVISGRPPVTDLYETVIWVSFIGMVFAVILEGVYRKRFFFYAGIPASILTLILADSNSTILDASINPLTPVLRNNMWLTIHVLTIVSSYAAFVLTAALGHIALAMTFWGKRYAKTMAEVQFFIYRAMQIGILLLATGTILGGVWANYSWGRFWGWDPKETWALITLLCYLALLHGRLAGWWGGFGLAIGSVLCFLSVLMSWYGVNFILGQNGRSLHSYGLSTGGFDYAAGFAIFEIAFVAAVIAWNRRQPSTKPEDLAVPAVTGSSRG